MVSQTLFLTAGMPRQVVLDHLETVQQQRGVNAIHIVDYDFGRQEDIAHRLIEVLHADDRPWHTIKLAHCRGEKMVNQLVQAITCAANVRRLILSPTPLVARSCLSTLATGLALSSSKSIMTLCIQDVRFTRSLMEILCQGLKQNESIVDLSFTNCRLMQEDGSHQVLGETLSQMDKLQHLSLSNCRLEDAQCQEMVQSLVGATTVSSLMELNMDGNRCQFQGLKALSNLLKAPNSLLALDLSNQKISAGSMDLTRLTPGLEQSRLKSLQLSGNVLSDLSLQALSKSLMINQHLSLLHLAWVPLDERAMMGLATALRRNSSLQKLVMYGCGMDNTGLMRFSHRMRQMKGLRHIDMGGLQRFDAVGLQSLVAALQRNTQITQAILPTDLDDTIYMGLVHQAVLLCDANRAGRRFLRDQATASIALWALILSKVPRLELPNLMDGADFPSILPAAPILDEEDIDEDINDNISTDEDMDIDEDADNKGDDDDQDSMELSLDRHYSKDARLAHKNDPGFERRTSVLYHLLRNGPLLQL